MNIKFYGFKHYKVCKYLIVLCLFQFSSSFSQSENNNPIQENKSVPRFNKGTDVFYKLILNKLVIPDRWKLSIDSLKISFLVSADGSLSSFENLSKSNNDIYNEARKIVFFLGNWEPALNSENKPIDAVTVISIPLPDEIFTAVEEAPKFIGGVSEMYRFINENLKYPIKARDKKVSGRVFVKFVVEKDGSIGDIEIQRGIGSGCDQEAIRVIKSMPKWKPGLQNGKKMRVYFNMPVVFKLDY